MTLEELKIVISAKTEKFQEGMEQVRSKFKDIGEDIEKFNSKIKKSINDKVKPLIKKAMDGLTNYIKSALRTNDEFMSSLNTVKTNLRVAFQPIYDFILPAIQTLMGTLATLSGYMANFTSALFGKTYKESYDAAKSIETKGEASGFEMKMPDTSTADLLGMEEFAEKSKTLFQPTLEALEGLKTALEPLKSFIAQGLQDFYNSFLIPVGEWVLGEGLPMLIEGLSNLINGIDWGYLSDALNSLWTAITPFAINVGEGLLWFLENILVPLRTWTMNEVVPGFLNILAEAISILNGVVEALQPLAQWLWDNFLQPLAEWTGGVIANVLEGIAEGLKKVGDWITDNHMAVENIAIVIGSFMAAWKIVDLGVMIGGIVSALANFVTTGGLATVVTNGLTAAMAFITSPVTLAVAAIGALIAIGVLLYKNWETIGPWLKDLWEGIKVKAIEAWTSMKDFFVKIWEDITTKASQKWNDIKNNILDSINSACTSLKEIWDNIKVFILDKWTQIKDGILNMKDSLVNAIKEPFTMAKDWIDGVIKDASNWGKNLISNIVDGITASVGKVKDAVSNIASTISDYLGFRSPSKKGPGSEADKWMPNLMDMLANGIEDNLYKVIGAVNITADTLQGIERTDSNGIASAVGSAVMAAMQMGNTGQSSKEDGDIILQIDGTTIGRILSPIIDKEKGRMGNVIIQPI